MPDKKDKYEQLNQVIADLKDQPGALMPVLQKAQGIFGCVPMDVQKIIAEGLGVTLSEVYGVSTFYSQFRLEPNGKYTISVCLGTACYVKGSQKVLDRLSEELNTPVGKTSPDGMFTLYSNPLVIAFSSIDDPEREYYIVSSASNYRVELTWEKGEIL